MSMSNEDYQRLAKQQAPPSPLARDLLWAFCVGGGICLLGQVLLELYQSLGLSAELAGSAVSVTLIFLSALLTGLGLFDTLAKHAGAGTLVPITGFANAVVSPALEFRSEGLTCGTCVKLFSIAGPVIVWGTAASALYGLILWLMQL